MLPYTFEGASDDIVIVIADGVAAEYEAYDGAQFRLRHPTGQMQITVRMDDDSGCWHASIGQTDEVHPLPGWPITAVQSRDHEYTVRLTVDTPDGTVLEVTG